MTSEASSQPGAAEPGAREPVPAPWVAPVRVGILGSCVARDTLETMPRERWTVAVYLARTSILSVGSDASPNTPRELAASSPFQLRNVRADIEGRVLGRLAEQPIDVLVWDLVDERHGVHLFPDGSALTRSIDMLGMPELVEAVEGSRHLVFGDDEHYARWAAAAAAFADGLDAVGLRDRTLVLAPDWALADLEGEATPWSMGVSAEQANRAFPRYFERLERLGFEVRRFEGLLADRDHRWGLAPFHFSAPDYARLAGAIEEFAGRAGALGLGTRRDAGRAGSSSGCVPASTP